MFGQTIKTINFWHKALSPLKSSYDPGQHVPQFSSSLLTFSFLLSGAAKQTSEGPERPAVYLPRVNLTELEKNLTESEIKAKVNTYLRVLTNEFFFFDAAANLILKFF